MRKPTDDLRPVHAIAALSVFVPCSLVYSNSLDVPFLFDDTTNITDTRSIRLVYLDADKADRPIKGSFHVR